MDGAFGLLLQYPDDRGEVRDLRPIIEKAHAAGLMVAVASDLLALTLLVPPGEMGADAVDRQLAAVRRAARVRWAARGVSRHPRAVRPAGGRADHRLVGRRDRPPARCAWRSRRGSSTSAARRRRPTSAPPRRCSPTSRRCMRCITGRRGFGPSPSGSTTSRGLPKTPCARWGSRRANAPYFDTLRIEGAPASPPSARRRKPPASTSATTAPRSASRSTKRRRSMTSATSSASSRTRRGERVRRSSGIRCRSRSTRRRR